jgi:5-methyltetrahydrofolate--homocysteine methyltransferase
MIIVGELINATRKAVKAAIEDRDHAFIQKLAREQADAGATYIDVNAGVFVEKEAEYLNWVIDNVTEVTDLPVCIDSPSSNVIEKALIHFQGKSDKTPMINSISLETEKLENILPVVAGTDLKVIALCMNDKGMPHTVDERLETADKLINKLVQNNVKTENIFVDPLLQALATDSSCGTAFLTSIEKIMDGYPRVHTICGLSNISFGLPKRGFLNQTFMAMAIAKGLDGAIANPLNEKMMAAIITAETLAGRDEYCMAYLGAYRAGKIDFK